MANYVIVGGGPSGLYVAYRLLKSGKLTPGIDTVNLYEWSDRVGGRIYTYTFPPSIATNGLYAEVGGMRFATDGNFSKSIVEGHVLVQNMIVEMNLQSLVVPFLESPIQQGVPHSGRMYYLRGSTAYENSLNSLSAFPYRFNPAFFNFMSKYCAKPYTADSVLAGIAGRFVPGKWGSNGDRPKWCSYYSSGTVPGGTDSPATPSFPAGTTISDIGYWNLLYDQLGDEGFDYTADGNGYTSNVINWNSADAMQANNDYGSGVSYSRLLGGYSLLFTALAGAIENLIKAKGLSGSGIHYKTRLVSFEESGAQTICTFADASGNTAQVNADALFLAMPRRSLEIVAAGSDVSCVLNDDKVRYYLESSIDQPAIKAIMVFDKPWWQSAPNAPFLQNDPWAGPVGGPTITDLPLRQIYYFGVNTPAKGQTGPFVLLASYDDMNYSDFWRQLEIEGRWQEPPSDWRQPLVGPTPVRVKPVPGPFASLLVKQLAEAHGMTTPIPTPLAVYFQDWGQDPYGGGYHGWSAHYNICQVMDNVRAPYQKILDQPSGPKVFITGSCYSFDQAWVEGAFCTAESVLQEFLGLPPFRGVTQQSYALICTANM